MATKLPKVVSVKAKKKKKNLERSKSFIRFRNFLLHQGKMARLVSYKVKDENRYSTFGGEISYNSSENLTERNRIKFFLKKKTKRKDKTKENQKKNVTKANEMKKNAKESISEQNIENYRNHLAQQCEREIGSSSHIENSYRERRRHVISKSKMFCCFNSEHINKYCKCNPNRLNCLSSECICCWLFLCCRRKCGCIDNDDDDDDDIDAKFEKYKYEMRLKELNQESNEPDISTAMQEGSVQLNFKRMDMPIASNDVNSESSTGKTASKIFQYRKYWNWNDSLRSNSDKFLETLEYDMDGEQSLKRTNTKCKQNYASAYLTKG